MSMVRYIPNPNTLGRKVSLPGGKKIGDAVADAESGLVEITPEGLMAIDQAIETIAKAMALPAPYSDETLETVYRQACDIQAAAALFGLSDLGEAAWSLCELVDSGGARSRDGRPALASHLNSLRLLRLGEAVEASQRRAVLDGLQDLLAHTRQELSPT